MVDQPYERLVLADDLHLTWSAHLLTIATARWDPGMFVYDLEYLSVEVKPGRSGKKVSVWSRGQSIPFQRLPLVLDDEAYERFKAFVIRMREHRDRLRNA